MSRQIHRLLLNGYALAAIGCAVLPAVPAGAETRALLAGVWKFQSGIIPDLEGPQNDLTAMESLIRGEGATDVTVLRNDGVTRTTFETALHALGLRSKPGDWIFIYYSGHGAEADAAVKGTADGDTDQFLPLAGFDPDHQDAERFIVDKDLYAWVARYVPRDVEVFMIADACHSGTLHRSIDPRAWHFTPRLAFRNVPGYEIKLAARPAPRFPGVLGADDAAPTRSIQRADLPNEIYIGAAQDDQLALEASMPAEGAPSRGLLTYSFEQALTQVGADGKTLAADADHDGTLSVGELAVYLDSQVRALTGQRQESSAHYVSGADRLALFQTLPKPVAPAPNAAPLPAVWIVGHAQTTPLGWRLASAQGEADFVWDTGTGAVLRRSGDTVAEKVMSDAQLAGVIEKWGAVDALRPLLNEQAARVTITPGPSGARHAAESVVSVALAARDAPAVRYATIFNLASDGTVQRLYPLDRDGDGRMNGTRLPVLDNRVVAPYGVDHVVALVTPAPPAAFRATLRTADGQRGAGRLVAPIKALLAADPGAALSIGELYTGG